MVFNIANGDEELCQFLSKSETMTSDGCVDLTWMPQSEPYKENTLLLTNITIATKTNINKKICSLNKFFSSLSSELLRVHENFLHSWLICQNVKPTATNGPWNGIFHK